MARAYPFDGNHATSMRYILYSHNWGVYLGNGVWSLVGAPGAINTAPTYKKGDALNMTGPNGETAFAVQYVEVHPDVPGPDKELTFASFEALEKAMIPGPWRWEVKGEDS